MVSATTRLRLRSDYAFRQTDAEGNYGNLGGQVVAEVAGIGGVDMVDYNQHNGQYYAVARSTAQGPVLAVIDAHSNALVQTLALPGGSPHSVASSETTGKVYVPVGALHGGDGSIHVFAPGP